MKFEEILPQLRLGLSACRNGWNGKGMYIQIQFPDSNSKMGLPYFYMLTANGQFVPWVASNLDLLCEDWQIVENVT
jgi:hypothetical protein